MKKQSLLQTNPYLSDTKMAKALIERSVVSSCGVEGIKVDLTRSTHFVVPEHIEKRSGRN